MDTDKRFEDCNIMTRKISSYQKFNNRMGDDLLKMSACILTDMAATGWPYPEDPEAIFEYTVMMIVRLCKRSYLNEFEILRQVSKIFETEKKGT